MARIETVKIKDGENGKLINLSDFNPDNHELFDAPELSTETGDDAPVDTPPKDDTPEETPPEDVPGDTPPEETPPEDVPGDVKVDEAKTAPAPKTAAKGRRKAAAKGK